MSKMKINGGTEPMETIISDHLAEALLRGYSDANPGKIVDSKDFELILKWAEEAEISKALLIGIMEGDILPSVNKRRQVVFSVSKKGIAKEAKPIKHPDEEKVQ